MSCYCPMSCSAYDDYCCITAAFLPLIIQVIGGGGGCQVLIFACHLCCCIALLTLASPLAPCLCGISLRLFFPCCICCLAHERCMVKRQRRVQCRHGRRGVSSVYDCISCLYDILLQARALFAPGHPFFSSWVLIKLRCSCSCVFIAT